MIRVEFVEAQRRRVLKALRADPGDARGIEEQTSEFVMTALLMRCGDDETCVRQGVDGFCFAADQHARSKARTN